MKRILVVSGLILLLSASYASICAAQIPCVALYFDRALTQLYGDCPEAPAGTVLDTLYLAAFGFDTPMEGIEYKIEFPPEIAYLGTMENDNCLFIGDPFNGRALAFVTPQDASSPVIIQEFHVLWLCQGCTTVDIPITVEAHPLSGSLRVVTSDLAFVDVVGYTSYVCPGIIETDPRANAAAVRAAPARALGEQCVLECPAGDGGIIIPGSLPGQVHSPDLDGDGLVSIVDFSNFHIIFSQMGPFDPDMDFYCSGNVDLIDFVLFARHWQHNETTPVESSTWGNIKARYKN